MNRLNFREIFERANELYQEERYAQAYALLTQEAERFPGWENRFYFWRMCLATRKGDRELALKIFNQAVEGGQWFYESGLREDADLALLQGHPEFERLAAISRARQDEARAQATPTKLVYKPETVLAEDERWPLLIALHGNNNSALDSADFWRPTIAQGWLFALPQSTQAGGPESFVWSDLDWAEEEIRGHWDDLRGEYPIDPDRLVVGGFSMGGRLAIRLALSGGLPARGFLAICPYLPVEDGFDWEPLYASAPAGRLRGYFITGEQDSANHLGSERMAASLNELGVACEIESFPDMGHAYPPGMYDCLQRALDFLTGE